MRHSLLVLIAVIAFALIGPCAEAALLIYDFDSAALRLHGEITFDDANANFTAGGTVTVANGGIVDYFFDDGSSYWDLNDSQAGPLAITFGAGGTTPDDINRQSINSTDDQLLGNTGVQLFMPAVNSTNGNHGVSVGSTRVFDGTYSISAAANSVPEPASLWLLSGAAAWWGIRRRRSACHRTQSDGV